MLVLLFSFSQTSDTSCSPSSPRPFVRPDKLSVPGGGWLLEDETHYLELTPHSAEGLSLWANNNFEQLCSTTLKSFCCGSAVCVFSLLRQIGTCLAKENIWSRFIRQINDNWGKGSLFVKTPTYSFDVYVLSYRSRRLEEWFLAVIRVEGRARRPSLWHIQPQDENRHTPTHIHVHVRTVKSASLWEQAQTTEQFVLLSSSLLNWKVEIAIIW